MKIITLRTTLMIMSLQLLSIPAMSQLKDIVPFRINDKLSVLPAPGLSYKQETSWSFGVSLISTYNPNPDQTVHISTSQLDLIYTLRKQFIIDLDHSLYINDGQWITSGSNSYYNYPEYYYSQAQMHQDTARELIKSKRLEFDNRLFYNIQANWYGGLVHRFQYITDLQVPKRGLFRSDWEYAAQSGSEHGIGLGILNDSRDNQLNPGGGSSYLMLTATSFSHLIGSKSQFTRFEIDYRRYINLGSNQTLAFQAFGIMNTGKPPFRLTGMLGGSRQMRAYYYGYHRNRQYITVQAELRIHLYKRIGMVIFGGLGNTADKLNEIFEYLPLPSYGTGLRIMLDRKNRANLRIDYAIGRNTSGWYISYGEAF